MNKLSNVIKHFESNIDILTTTLLIIILELIFRLLVGFESFSFQALIFALAIAVLLTSVMYLMGKKLEWSIVS